MTQVLLGLFSGIAFGYVIQRVGATNPNKMALSHLMKEPYIPQFMVLAVALSAAGLFVSRRLERAAPWCYPPVWWPPVWRR